MDRKILSFSIIIILSGLLAYSNSFRGDFIWDDEALILNNDLIKSIHSWDKIITQELMDKTKTNYYRPVQVFSYIVDYRIWKLNPFGYHITNFLIHILNAILIYLFVMNIMLQATGYRLQAKSLQLETCSLKPNFIPLLTALFWVVHPVHVEAVTYISGRADLLAAFFILSAFLLYIKGGQLKLKETKRNFSIIYHLSSIICFELALFSKEMSLIFPAILICYEYFFRKQEKLSFRMKRLLPFLLVAIFYIFLRFTILNFALASPLKKAIIFSPNNIIRILSFLKGTVLYLGLLVMPINLHMERFMLPAKTILDPDVLLFIFLLIISLIILKNLKGEKRRFILFGMVCFFIFLFPQSNFMFIALMAEHYLYLPSIGIFLVAACGFNSLYNNRIIKKSLVPPIVIAILIFFGLLTFSQNYVWRNPLTFYRWEDRYARLSYITRNNLANIYAFLGKDDLAIEKYEQALTISPNTAIIKENITKIEDNLIEKYKNVIKSQPGFAVNYYNLAYLYERKGRVDEAIIYYKKAIELKPNFVEAISNLGNVYERQGKFEQALTQYQRAVAVEPNFAQGYFNIGVVLAEQGKLEQAREYFAKALKIKPDYHKAVEYISQIEDINNN